jgi:capsid protein
MKLFQPSTWPIFKRSTNSPSALMGEAEMLRAVKAWNDKTPAKDHVLRVLTDFDKMVRSYAAGQFDEYNADFKGTYGSANTEIMPGLYSVRARTRTLVKDTPQGKVVRRTYQNNVVGDSLFKLDMRYGKTGKSTDAQGKPTTKFILDTETNEAVQKFWEWFLRQENFTVRKTMSGMEAGRMVEGTLITDGRVICRLHADYPMNEIKFAVDFLESDRVQEQWQGLSGSDSRFGAGNPIRGSVEYHKKWQYPLAYWILMRHPGDSLYGGMNYSPGTNPNTTNFREQVPAAEIIDINNLRDRPEQDIGMTEFDAAVQPIWRNNQFTKALTLCAIASHIRAFILEKKLPTGIQMPHELQESIQNALLNFGANGNFNGGDGDGNYPAHTQQGVGKSIDTLKPGQERELPYGYEAKVLAPPFPTEQSHEFRLDNHREVAIATGVSYQHASGDYQNLGFIAGLMCQIPFQDWCKIRQKHLVECWIGRMFREALRAAIMTGWFDRRGYHSISIQNLEGYCDAAHFKGKRWAFVNPMVQAQTLILLLEAKIMSPQQVQDELPDGVSIEDLYTMWAEAKEEAEKHDLDIEGSDPTRPGIEKGEPGLEEPNPEGGEPPARSKKANPLRSSARSRVSMDALLRMSTNGEH